MEVDVAESHGPISWNPLDTPRHNRSNRSVFPWRAWSVEHGHPGHHVLEAAVWLAPAAHVRKWFPTRRAASERHYRDGEKEKT